MSKNINTDYDLEYIGSLIANGFTSGYYPYWKLSLIDISHYELSDATLDHIAEFVVDGYVEGEISENYHTKSDRGWWKLQI
ncbi:MAG: hypothetical protein Q7U36_00745 [bacterium]|nr:hypothetical protein [bacterium]